MKNKRIAFSFYWLLVAAIVLLPINGKQSKLNDTYIFNFRLDFVFHIILFIPWAFFKPIGAKNKFSWILLGLFFALASECIQYLIPYRAFNVNDLMANILGVFLGLLIYNLFLSTLKTKRKKLL